jgi:LmbE family N-acetylglucosaminyl deacetylase
MKKRIFILLTGFLPALFVAAQAPPAYTAADIYLGLKKLKVTASVLYIAAHPDDENTRLLAYFSKEKLYRTAYLSLTRGDGGQNLIGDEQGVDLGLIRTQELLAARRIDGAEQFFTRAFDFGFSKSPEETMKLWDREKVLADMVWVIRRFKPDVIITRFPTTGEGGHGHHTASGILAEEAFKAAADPKRFPQQLKIDHTTTWQATRLVWNSFNFGGNNTTRDSHYKFDVGAFNAVLGKSYGEIAAESRSQHKSQGFGVPSSRGPVLEYFKTIFGEAPVNDIMDGVQTNWNRFRQGVYNEMVDSLLKDFSFEHPEQTVPGLVKFYQALLWAEDEHWREKKLREVEDLLVACSGLYLEASSAAPFAITGDSLRVKILLNNRSGANIHLTRLSMDRFDSSFTSQALAANRNMEINTTIAVPDNKTPSQPYWLEWPMTGNMFDVRNQKLIGNPDTEAAYHVTFMLTIEGQPVIIKRALKYKFTDPVKGELFQPLVVVPAVTVTAHPSLVIQTNDQPPLYHVGLKTMRDRALINGQLIHWAKPKVISLQKGITMAEKNVEREFSSANNMVNPGTHIFPGVRSGDAMNNYSLTMRQIKYDHIPTITYYKPAEVMIKKIDVKIRGKKIGYIEGAGDKVPEALKQMGYEVTLLTDNLLSTTDLNQYDAIVTGVRAYNTRESLNGQYDRLMEYVKQGGNLVVQYNTNNQLGPVKVKISPYPFTISRNRVTDEQSPVQFLKPEHPLLNTPNVITQKDFDGWIQERGIYFATDLAPEYETILSMNDPGEAPMNGSLVVAKHGKGNFIYTGLAFFRELPAGVEGAYRLFANILSLGKTAKF